MRQHRRLEHGDPVVPLTSRLVLVAAGIAVFAAGSIGCGLAPSVAALLGARVIQGVGCALMVPTSLALIGATFPETGARQGDRHLGRRDRDRRRRRAHLRRLARRCALLARDLLRQRPDRARHSVPHRAPHAGEPRGGGAGASGLAGSRCSPRSDSAPLTFGADPKRAVRAGSTPSSPSQRCVGAPASGGVHHGGGATRGADDAARAVPLAHVQRRQSDDPAPLYGAGRGVLLHPVRPDPHPGLFGCGGRRRLPAVSLDHDRAVALVGRSARPVRGQAAADRRAPRSPPCGFALLAGRASASPIGSSSFRPWWCSASA